MNTPDKKINESSYIPNHSFDAAALAYIKAVETRMGNGFAIYAADGSQLAIYGSRDAAIIAAKQHDLEPVQIH